MANSSSEYFPPSVYMFIITGSVDHMIGIPVNCWALWVIVSEKLIESEILTLNLIVTETTSSVGFISTVIQVYWHSPIHHSFTFFYVAAAVVARVLFQCHVCVDRYLGVIHPLVFLRYKQVKYRAACLAVIWLVVTSAGLINVFAPFNPIAIPTSSFGVLLPALFTELYCSLSIVRILRKPGPGNKSAQERRAGNQQKKTAIKIIRIVLVMLVINVLPFIVLPFIHGVSFVDLLPVAFTLSTAGSSAQAFLFLSRSGKLPCKNKH